MTDFPCLTGIFPRITYTHYSSCFSLIPCKKGVSVFFVAALEILECGTKFSCKSSFKAEQTQQSQLFFIWQASKSLGYVCVGLSLDCPCLYRFSFFNSRAQHWREWNKCGLTSAVQRGIMRNNDFISVCWWCPCSCSPASCQLLCQHPPFGLSLLSTRIP